MGNKKTNEISSMTKTLDVLYVNNENDYNDDFIIYLENKFNKIIYAKDAKEAIEVFETNKISIVITDIEIGSINGFELIENILELNKNTLTIIYSELQTHEYFLKTIELGIDGYLLKPFKKEDFKKILNKSIKKCQVKKANKKIKKNFELLTQYQELVDKSTIISKTNASGVITYVNDNFCKVSEYSKDELIGKNHNIVRHPDNSKELFTNLWDTIKNKKSEWHGIVKNLTKSGKPYYVKTTIKPILDEKGNIIEYISARSNVSAIMSDKKQLIDRIDDNNLSLLVLIQIEEFDMLDKFYNIDTVNKIEKVFSYNILSCFPSGFIFEDIYNIGNGRFALLTDFFAYSKSEQNINNYLKEFVKNVKNSAFEIDDIEYDFDIVLSYSFGKENLFEDAKCGLDDAIKEKGLIKYANDLSIKEHIEAKKNIEVIKMVKIALDNYKIISYFQPIINNKTKEIEKYESLVRLVDEKGKVLTPYMFLDISKKGSYYTKITHRVLENSFKMLNNISTELSINLSSVDIEREDTRKLLFDLLNEHRSDAHRIVFELLEDENVKNFEVIKSFIRKVKKMGVQIAIDDFGSGYSNFERLLDFEPDIVKIDGTLVKNIVDNNFSKSVVETIVSFAQKQNIVTIAEYVENEEIFNILNDLGVDYSQGYFFGKPEDITVN